MPMQGEATRITLLVTQTLERLGIPYAVGGSLASSLHGVMRSTLDVDIVADRRLEHIQPLVAAPSKWTFSSASRAPSIKCNWNAAGLLSLQPTQKKVFT